MDAGTTFVLAADHHPIDNHLWVVISDTTRYSEELVVVSVTTNAPEKDQACVIERHEHPWLTHQSCISYRHAKVVKLSFLLDRKDKGSIILGDPVSAPLLARIRQGAGDSTTLDPDLADILIEQGIINLSD